MSAGNTSLCEGWVDGCCTEDFDCVGNLICLGEVNWSPKTNFCECSLWYGWWGDDCTLWGPTSYFLLFAILIETSILTNLLYYVGFTVHQIYRKQKYITHHGKITLLFGTLAAYFLLQWRIMELINVSAPQDHTYRAGTGDGLSQNGDAKMQKLTRGTRISVVLLGFFVVLATFNLPLLWLEKAESRTVESWYPRMRTLQAIYMVSSLVVIATGRVEIIAGISLVILAVIGITIAIFRHKYYENMREHHLSFYINGTLASLVLESVFTLIYSIYFGIGWKKYNAKNELSSFVVFNEGMIFSIILTLVWVFKTCKLSIVSAPGFKCHRGETKFGITSHQMPSYFKDFENEL